VADRETGQKSQKDGGHELVMSRKSLLLARELDGALELEQKLES
jgi:hypothetical protein